MKYWLSYTMTVVLLGILFTLFYYIVSPYKQKNSLYTSPIPDFLLLRNNNQVTLLDLWTPIFETFVNYGQKPDIKAKSVLVYDLINNHTLYESNIKDKLPMASLTKIMTAIITLDNPLMPEEYLVRQEDLVGEDSMGLVAGEVLTKNELLYGLLLNSGNDAAEVLAHNYPDGKAAFIQAMQDKAKVIGLSDTRFSNPSGLQGDGLQYTTASDLLIMTRYALDNFPLFRKIVSTYQYNIPSNNFHQAYNLVNETNLLSTYPGVKGVKTGYTPEAGMCLTTYYESNGVQLLAILLNSPDRRSEMKELLDYSLLSLGVTPPPHD